MANKGSTVSSDPVKYSAQTIKFPKLLDTCLDIFGMPKLLSIDIEGLEESILSEYSFNQCVIPILCVEHLLPISSGRHTVLDYQHSALVQYLQQNGYLLVSVCAISLVFVHETFWHPYK